MSQRPCRVLPWGLEQTGQAESLPQPSPPSEMTARAQEACSSPQGNLRSWPAPRAAYSHSASLCSLAPAHSENCAASAQPTKTTGRLPWSAATGQPHLGGVQPRASTQAWYCALVTGVLAIWKGGTATRWGLASGRSSAPIMKLPPGMVTQSMSPFLGFCWRWTKASASFRKSSNP